MAVEIFRTFSDFDRQSAEARKRRRMADLLAQQVVEPTDYGRGPTPAAAPLVRGLQSFLAARAAKKADEAEETALETKTRAEREAEQRVTAAGSQIAGRLTGGAPIRDVAPPDETGLGEVAIQSQYRADPQDAFRLALTPVGGEAMQRNPLIAARLAQLLEKKEPKAPTVAGGMQWNAEKGSWEEIPGYARQQGEIAEARRPPAPQVVVKTGGGAAGGPSMGKPPSGYRWTPDGNLEAIPGGPQDPGRMRNMPGGVLQAVTEEKTRGARFANISQRADEFINILEKGDLPLDPLSAAKYQAARLLDSTRGKAPSGAEPYVRFFELQRFVNEQVNAILNLAKGPQTEGDALRARQQILDNPNNEKVVISALKNLQRIYNNEVELSKQNVANFEREYGRNASMDNEVIDLPPRR